MGHAMEKRKNGRDRKKERSSIGKEKRKRTTKHEKNRIIS